MTKKIFALLLALLMVFSVAACGDSADEPKDGAKKSADKTAEKTGWFTVSDSFDGDPIALGTPKTTLDPKTVYGKVKYEPQMFYGQYKFDGGETAEADYEKQVKDYIIIDVEQISSDDIADVPYRIKAGPTLVFSGKERPTDDEIMCLTYTTSKGYLNDIYAAYTIESGNILKLTLLENWEFDYDKGTVDYSLSDEVIEYKFEFSGRNLKLTYGADSITLKSALSGSKDEDYVSVLNYYEPGTECLDEIGFINLNYTEGSDYSTATIRKPDDETYADAVTIQMTEDGLFTMSVKWNVKTTNTYQFVYFYLGYEGLILTDGTEYYYYTQSYSDHNTENLKEYVAGDETALEGLTDDELKKVVQAKDDIMGDLEVAFSTAGITVTVDAETGEIRMDSAVLFGGDSSKLSDKGKTFLNKFMKAYTSIICSDDYSDLITKTIIEGHTAPLKDSTYESGLPLSQERADVVKEYCLSDKTGVDTKDIADTFEAVGLSNSEPVKNQDGSVNLEASRRVSFKFVFDIENVLSKS